MRRRQTLSTFNQKAIKQISLFSAWVMELFAAVGWTLALTLFWMSGQARPVQSSPASQPASLQLLCPLLNINKNIMPPQWHSRCSAFNSSLSASRPLSLSPAYLEFLFMLQSLPHIHRHGHATPLATTPHAFLHSTQTIEHLFKQSPVSTSPSQPSSSAVEKMMMMRRRRLRRRRVNAPKAK